MAAGPLWQDENAGNHEGRENCRGVEATHGKPAIRHRLIEQITYRGAEWAREYEGTPEEKRARDVGEEIGCGNHGQPRGEHERPAFVSETGRVGHPVAKCGSQGLGK